MAAPNGIITPITIISATRHRRLLFSCRSLHRRSSSSRCFCNSNINCRSNIDSLLLRGVFSGNPKLTGMCTPLYDHRDWLWTFLDLEGVEPTNNVSERALRPAVIWRKLSFGTQSARGSRFVETILTVVETCHRQSRNSFEYITDAMQAHLAGQPAPSLLAGV